ncbi:MAG: zf-HC2 domain-containing protein [Treponema sp.]|nr:zf-HC2 domain-containing protein [Treponema sp.]
MSFCPSKDIHSVYLDGELPESYKAEYELHLQSCESCQKELEKMKALHLALKADAESIKLDSKFMEDSFQRLQIKMAYSKNVGRAPEKSPLKVIGYVASGVAAAAVFALVLPLGLKSANSAKSAGSSVSSNVINSPLVQTVGSNSAVPITAVSKNKSTSANNLLFDSGRSVVVSGNIQDVVLSSEKQRKNHSSFAAANVNDVDVLRPDFEKEAISIKITVPGMGDFPVTTEINLPVDVASGKR